MVKTAVNKVIRRLAAQLTRDDLLRAALDEALVATGMDDGAVYAWDESADALVLVALAPTDEDEEPAASVGSSEEYRVLKPGAGAMMEAVAHRRPIVVDDYQVYPRALPVVARAGVRAMVTVPMQIDAERIGGLVVMTFDAQHRFGRRDVESLDSIATATAGMVMSRERGKMEGALAAMRLLAPSE